MKKFDIEKNKMGHDKYFDILAFDSIYLIVSVDDNIINLIDLKQRKSINYKREWFDKREANIFLLNSDKVTICQDCEFENCEFAGKCTGHFVSRVIEIYTTLINLL